MTELLNVQTRIVGELRDRPGLGTRWALQADRLAFLEVASGRYVIARNGSLLTSIDYDDSSSAAGTFTSGSATGCFAACLGAVYFVDGSDAMKVVYDPATTWYDAGIVAPSAAPTVGSTASGSVTAGIHLIRYRYKNSVTGYVSDPSDATSYTAPGSQTAPLTLVASGDAKVDKIIVEMTQAAGDVYYVVATTTNTTSYTINMDDDTLGVQQLADVYSAPDGFGQDPPPVTLTVVVEHKNRLFGIADDTLYWSRASFPEGWNILDWAKKIFTSGGDKPIALGSYFGDLYIFGQQGMARLVYTADPATGMLIQMPANMGVWNQQCVVSVEGELFGFGRCGVFRISAIQPDLISQPVQMTAADDVDENYAVATAFAFFDPDERVVWCMYRSVDDTSVRSAICFDLQTETWSRRSFRHTINAGITFSTTVSASAAYLAQDNYAYVHRLEAEVWDGHMMDSGVLTVGPGTTTTSIYVQESLPTSPDLTGCIIYSPTTGEERLCNSSTANHLTVNPGFSVAPAFGTELYAGSFPQRIRSGHQPVHYVNAGRRPEIFNIEHLSVAEAIGVTVEVRYYVDYSATPMTWSVNSDPQTGGLSVFSTYATQLLDSGRAMVPVPSDWMLTIQWDLQRTRPEGRMRLLDARFDWQDQKAQDVPH